MLKARSIFWMLAAGGLLVDQLIKYVVRSNLVEHQSITLIPRVLDATLTYNRGIAFGMFQGAGVLLAPIAVAIGIGAYIYVHRNPHESRWMHSAMGLLAAGAIGNLVDRVAFGRVTDMIAVRFINFPVFNIADSCITVAGAILVVTWMGESVKNKPESKDLTIGPPEDSGETSPAETKFS